jgi:hypothetical protein
MIVAKEKPRFETGEDERSEASREADGRRRDKVRRRIFSNVPPEFSDYRRFAPGKSSQDVRFAFQRAAIRDERLTAWERLVVVFIVERFLVAEHRAVVSDRLIREALGISIRSIARARAKLEELGLVWTRGGTGKGDPLVYFIRVAGLFVTGTDANSGVPQTPTVASSTSELTSKRGFHAGEDSPPVIIEHTRDRRPGVALEEMAQEIEAASTVTEACGRMASFTPDLFALIGPRKLRGKQVSDRLVRAARFAQEMPPGPDLASPARIVALAFGFLPPHRGVRI